MKLKLFFLASALSLFNFNAQNIPLYVGTYTDGDSKGIYQFQFNTETGKLSNKELAATIEHPSFISYNLDRTHIYAISEIDNGYVSAFKVEDTGKLNFLNKVSSNGDIPCHISFNKKGDMVVSNYGSGTISLYSMTENGSLNEAFQIFNHNTGNRTARAHSAHFFKNELYVADLGMSAVYRYHSIENDKKYELINPSIVKMTENSGSRHFTLTKDGQFMYIINEYASTITSAKRVNGKFELINHVSTLRTDFKDENWCADIHLSQDECFLYGSNRGENSIVVFKRDLKTGIIEKIQNISTQGDWPRNFTLDPTGKFLLAGNHKSNSIVVYKVNKNTGKLSFLNSIDMPAPVCLIF